MSVLDSLTAPIVQAPMAGGVSTVELAVAVSNAGGLGFVAGGYLSPDAFANQLREVRNGTARPFAANLFVPAAAPGDADAIAAYLERLAALANRHGVTLGDARFDDDHYDEKVAILLADPPAVVSFAFGCPARETIARLHDSGSEVWVTVTTLNEARASAAVGADVVVAQGAEAGAHRGSFADGDDEPLQLSALLSELRDGRVGLPVVAAGAIMDGADIARALAHGASASQLGTAFMLCPEAGTSAVHHRALLETRPTVLTRAFTGRRARGLANAWTEELGAAAPSAYPEVHYATAPLRQYGRTSENPDLVNLWAGTGYARARAMPAAQLVATLATEFASAR